MTRLGAEAGCVCVALLAAGAVIAPCAAQVAPPDTAHHVQVHDEMQPDTLPTLPPGMTLDMIVQGDSLFHTRGNCFACHGSEGQGLPAAGDAITETLTYVPFSWGAIDSLITVGLPDPLTRSPIGMPGRGGKHDLTDDQIQRIAAYVWAISQTHGEPWPGGHPNHEHMIPLGSTAGTAYGRPVRPLQPGKSPIPPRKP